jgi:hypothetical protein
MSEDNLSPSALHLRPPAAPRHDFTDIVVQSSSNAEEFLAAINAKADVLQIIQNGCAFVNIEKAAESMAAVGSCLMAAYADSVGSKRDAKVLEIFQNYVTLVKHSRRVIFRFEVWSLAELENIRNMFVIDITRQTEAALRLFARSADSAAKIAKVASAEAEKLVEDFREILHRATDVLAETNKEVNYALVYSTKRNTLMAQDTTTSALVVPSTSGAEPEMSKAISDSSPKRRELGTAKQVLDGVGPIQSWDFATAIAYPFYFVGALVDSLVAWPSSPEPVLSGNLSADTDDSLLSETDSLNPSDVQNQAIVALKSTVRALADAVAAMHNIKDYWETIMVRISFIVGNLS